MKQRKAGVLCAETFAFERIRPVGPFNHMESITLLCFQLGVLLKESLREVGFISTITLLVCSGFRP